MKAACDKKPSDIFGEGDTSRDFTFIENAVQANIKALINHKSFNSHEVFNIACGNQTSLLELWKIICDFKNINIKPNFMPYRDGDIRHSLADISKAKSFLGYSPNIGVKEGINITINE